jgi:hypothetical protein
LAKASDKGINSSVHEREVEREVERGGSMLRSMCGRAFCQTGLGAGKLFAQKLRCE